MRGVAGHSRPTCAGTSAGISTSLRRTAVREARASRHHGGPIVGPLKPDEHHGSMVLRGLSEELSCDAA